MFFRDLKPKSDVTLEVTLAHAYLPVKLGNRNAEATFAQPLQAQLTAAGLGTVMECRPKTRASGEVIGVHLFLGLTQATRSDLKTVASMLEYLSAPCGSSIELSDGISEPLLFGLTEGLELSIGTDAAPNAQARRDLAMACKDAIERHGVSRGWSEKNEKTLFYFYGESFVEMKRNLTKQLEDDTRFQSATFKRMA